MQMIAENLWVMRFPLALIGTQIGRTVTVIRLRSGELVIHSTAPFTVEDVASIGERGRPGWLVEATLFHDTFAVAARAKFPTLPYLVPEGFSALARVPADSLAVVPGAWSGELDVLPLDGMPKVCEHVFFHRPSRTLIVADLVFNFGPDATAWTRAFFRWAAGIRQFPGVSRLFRMSVRDRDAFSGSVRRIMEWDFDRLVVGHGDIIESGAKAKLATALAAHGF